MSDYIKIDGTQYKKIFVVGDLHGCFSLLMEKLKEVDFNFKTDLLISVGDLIDRGQENIECLRLIKENWFKAIRGNHEQMAINGINGNQQSLYAWMYNGGNWYFKLNALEHDEATKLINQCAKLPLIIELKTNTKTIAIAHADYPSNEYEFDKPVSNKQVIWSRERFENNDNSEIKGVDWFLFGHTPQQEITQIANRVYLDTGAIFNGNLIVTRIDNA